MTTVQLIAFQPSDELEATLKSLKDNNFSIYLGNCGDCYELAKKYKTHIVNLPWNNNYASVRNDLSKKMPKGWKLWIREGETVDFTNEELSSLLEDEKYYRIYINSGKFLRKEVRLWSGVPAFRRELYETLPHVENLVPLIISDENATIRHESDIAKHLSNKNLLSEQDFYQLCCYKFKNLDLSWFKDVVKNTFQKSNSYENCMMRYYEAWVYSKNKNYESAVKNLIICLAENPFMSEFWCLLADISLKMNHVGRAYELYKTAIAFGKQRDTTDRYPIDLSKYFEYPEKMIDMIKNNLNA